MWRLLEKWRSSLDFSYPLENKRKWWKKLCGLDWNNPKLKPGSNSHECVIIPGSKPNIYHNWNVKISRSLKMLFQVISR